MKKTPSTCPICKKKVRRIDATFPFCSERCRLLDLGNWASGRYHVPAPLPDTGEEISGDGAPSGEEPKRP